MSVLSVSRITAAHWYASRIYRTNPQSAFCGVSWVVRWVVRPGRRASKSRGLSRSSRGVGWLVAPSPAAARSRPAVHYILDFPQSSPSLSATRSTASPTTEYSTTAFQVPLGGSNPLFSLFPSCPDAGGLSSLSPGPSRPSAYLTDPSLVGTPRPGASYGSFLACLHHESHRERKDFLTALTRLLAMRGSLPHHSHAYRQHSVPFMLQQTVSSLSPIGRSGTSDTRWSEVVATPPTYTLYISLASGSIPTKGP